MLDIINGFVVGYDTTILLCLGIFFDYPANAAFTFAGRAHFLLRHRGWASGLPSPSVGPKIIFYKK